MVLQKRRGLPARENRQGDEKFHVKLADVPTAGGGAGTMSVVKLVCMLAGCALVCLLTGSGLCLAGESPKYANYPEILDGGGGCSISAARRSKVSMGQPCIGKCESSDFVSWLGFISGGGGCNAAVLHAEEAAADYPGLRQCTPNPFRDRTTIRYEIPNDGTAVRISVFSVRGQLVKTTVDDRLPAGKYQTVWNGTDRSGKRVASGIYYCVAEIGAARYRETLVLIR